VVDDGSRDGSPEVVEAYNDCRITLLRHPVNQGHGLSLNMGGVACGEWLVSQDSDDELLPGALRMMVQRGNEVGDENVEELLAMHGEALRAYAPEVYWQSLSGLVSLHFLAGRRPKGWRCALQCLRSKPASIKVWASLVLGSLGRRPIARLMAMMARIKISDNFDACKEKIK
jgi:glycosyltransferase involved in cell wall biosynthesis